MKIRNGFVSNSSSSSFIVAFDKTPSTIQEMKEILFGNEEWYENPYADLLNPAGFTTQQVAETVFTDLQREQPLSPENLVEEVKNGHFDGYPTYDWRLEKDETMEQSRERWRRHDIKVSQAAKNLADKFIQDNNGKVFFKFHYSDNNGTYETALEHGGLFDKLPHLVVSHH